MFILRLISSCMSFVFVTVTPRYLNFSTFSNDKLSMIEIKIPGPAGNRTRAAGLEGRDYRARHGGGHFNNYYNDDGNNDNNNNNNNN